MRRGQKIDERFEIKEQAGAGGMGTVYRAKDLQTGQAVAVKLLALDEQDSAERFTREAQVLSEVSHPGIVGYVAHGRHQDRMYLVMSWVKGRTLNRVMDTTGLSVAEVALVGQSVGRALEALHSHGVVHRDIKPSNLILPSQDLAGVTLLDFGLVRRTHERTGPTRTGLMVGSPGYMSPEQARGQRDVSAAADIFSLGCVLYECLTGRAAFEGTDAISIRSKVLMVDPKPVDQLNPEVPAPFAAFIQRMLAKSMSERPGHGGEVAAVLSALELPEKSARRVHQRSRFEAATAQLDTPSYLSDVSEYEQAETVEPSLKTRLVLLVGTDAEHPAPTEPIREALSAEGAYAERLDSGQLVTLFAGNGHPRDEAARAGRVALRVRAIVAPEVPMSLVADRSAEPDIDFLIERGVRALHQESMHLVISGDHWPLEQARIHLDAQAEQMLKGRFRVQRQTEGAYLMPDPLVPWA